VALLQLLYASEESAASAEDAGTRLDSPALRNLIGHRVGGVGGSSRGYRHGPAPSQIQLILCALRHRQRGRRHNLLFCAEVAAARML